MRDRIHRELSEHPDLDDETVAKQVVDSYRARADLAEAVMPLVVDKVANLRRRDTRRTERRVFEGGEVVDPTGELRNLLDRSIRLDDGRFVPWGEATVEDHRNRIAYLQRLADGIERTISVHRLAIATITAAKVETLGELDDDQLAPLLEALR